jgi:hypothetical protein
MFFEIAIALPNRKRKDIEILCVITDAGNANDISLM